jgi:proline iminopeptidase
MNVHGLPLGGGHVMHVEEHGNRAGVPALVLHGGPGSGASPLQRSFFDPARYRIVCPDQRGAGKSTPRGCIADNTLEHLLADLRLLREHLEVDRWLVVGGSWGATLALLHAIDQRDAIAGLVLRNPFLARAEDMERFPIHRDAELLASGSRKAAARWWQAEQRLSGGDPASPTDLDRLVDRYRVQSHYLAHGCWIAPPGLLAHCGQVPDVPIVILQGTEDALCPPEGAQALAQALGSRATLRWVHGAGHDPSHPAMAAAMRDALDQFAG